MAFLTETFSAPVSLSEKLSALRANFVEARAKRAVYKATLRELSELSSRDLADLGIHRSSIRRVAYESAYTN